MFDAVRRRAAELFEQRGGPGKDLDNWLDAEREFLWRPPAEVIETEKEYQIRVPAPGFDPGDLTVKATAESVIVEGENVQKRRRHDGTVLLREYGEQRLFRQFFLESPIDVEKITATLHKGELHIVAVKRAARQETKKITATA